MISPPSQTTPRTAKPTQLAADRFVEALSHADSLSASAPSSFRMLWKTESRFLYALLAVCALVYGQYFFTKGFTGADDIAYHVKAIYYFADSFKQGQWIPRTLAQTQVLTERSPDIADIPMFQYYSFFQGAAALPFMLLGFSALKSMLLSVILGRWIGACALYYAARLLKARSLMSFAGAFTYIISPYLVSNFYARGAIAETWAHSLLPLVILAWVYSLKEKWSAATLTTALAVAGLALSHNIFLLYGTVLIALLAILTFRFGPILAMAAGGVIGLFATAWQWLPAAMSVKDTFFGYLYTATKPMLIYGSPSIIGFLGAPAAHINRYTGHLESYFFTVGWWTIPSFILLAKYCRKETRPFAMPILVCAAVFFALTYTPFNPYAYLPNIFCAVQDTYRLLSFLSLLASFALPLALATMPTRWWTSLILFALLSQTAVLIQHRGGLNSLPDKEIASQPIREDYLPNPLPDEKIRFNDGTLWTNRPLNLSGPAGVPGAFVLSGTNLSNQPLQLIAFSSTDLKNSKQPQFALIPIGPYSVSVPIEANQKTILFVLRPNIAEDRSLPLNPQALFPVVITTAYAQWQPFESSIHFEKVRLTHSSGYTRTFQIDASVVPTARPDTNGFFHVELPLAYSSFWKIEQNGLVLKAKSNYNHRPEILTHNLESPINLKWTWPQSSLILSTIGLAMLAAVGVSTFRSEF